MRRLVMLGTMILAASIMLIACGSTADEAATDATPDAAGSSPAAPLPDETAPEEPTASSSIILPDGWTMTDALSADEVGAITGKKMVVFPEGSSAAQNGKPAGGYLVLGRNTNPAVNGGLDVAYRYAGVVLGNGADEIILLDPSGAEIDRVAYDGGATFPAPAGASICARTGSAP